MLTIDEDNGQQKDGDLSAAKRNHILLLQRTYLDLGVSLAFLGSRWRFWGLVGVWKNKTFSHSHTLGVECSILSSTECVTFRNESGFLIE